MSTRGKRIGEILKFHRLISATKLQRALDQQKINGGKLGEILVDRGYISEKDLLVALQEQFQVPIIDFDRAPQNPKALKIISPNFANEYLVLPITFIQVPRGLILVVAMENPSNKALIKHLNEITGYPIKPMLAGKRRLIQAILEAYRSESAQSVGYL